MCITKLHQSLSMFAIQWKEASSSYKGMVGAQPPIVKPKEMIEF